MLEVSEEAKKKATRCQSDLHCLLSTDKIYCAKNRRACIVEAIATQDALFVKPQTSNGCRYRLPFGAGYICQCPVRREIYLKYRL